MDAKRMARYQRDIVLWAEENVVIRNPGTGRLGPLRLEKHQAEWLRTATKRTGKDGWGPLVHKTVVASWPKREGKSLMAALMVCHRLCCFYGQRCVILANSEKQAASVIYDELVGLFRNSPTLAQYVTEDDIETRKLTVQGLGNEAICVPCNYRTVQGIAVTGILACDELHAAQDIRAYNYLAAQTEAVDAQIAISSQAGAPVQSNPVYRLYKASETEPHIHFDYLSHHVMPWAIALGERDRKTLLPAEWALLHENAWAGQGTKLLDPAWIVRAAQSYREPQTADEWRELVASWGMIGRAFRIGVGLDRAGIASTGDRTVWTVTAHFLGRPHPRPLSTSGEGREGTARAGETPAVPGTATAGGHIGPPLRTATAGTRETATAEGLFAMVMCRVMETGSEAEVIEVDRETRRIFGPPDRSLFEYYNCSDLVGKVDGASLETPTLQRQQGLFNRLHRLVREGRYWFPPDAGIDPRTGAGGLLQEELVSFEYNAERVGLTRYGTQGGHDDTCYSAAWSAEAADVVEEEAEERDEREGMVVRMEDLVGEEAWKPVRLGAARL